MRKIAGTRTPMVSDSLPSTFVKSRFNIPSPGEFGWIWIGLVVLFAVSLGIAPGTITRGSILAMLPFAGILAIVATGQTLVIQQRGLDMSAIGMISLAGVVMARTAFAFDSTIIAVTFTVFVAATVGTINGILVSRIAITPLVATLAVNALLIGGVRSMTGDVPVSVPTIMQTVSHAQLIGLPANVLIAFGFVVT